MLNECLFSRVQQLDAARADTSRVQSLQQVPPRSLVQLHCDHLVCVEELHSSHSCRGFITWSTFSHVQQLDAARADASRAQSMQQAAERDRVALQQVCGPSHQCIV